MTGKIQVPCPECGLVAELAPDGTVGRHSREGCWTPCKGSYQPFSCSCCRKQYPLGEDGRLRAHLGQGGLVCSGSGKSLVPSYGDFGRAAEELAAKLVASVLAAPAPHDCQPLPGMARVAGRKHRPRHDMVLEKPAASSLEPVPERVALELALPEPPSELCRGGTTAQAGCARCGDMIYMAATGRDGQRAPSTFEAWRDDHTLYGVPWAKERMLDYLASHHVGILDDGWEAPPGDAELAQQPAHVAKLRLPSVLAGVPAVLAMMASTAYFADWVLNGGSVLFIVSAVFSVVAACLSRQLVKRSEERSEKKEAQKKEAQKKKAQKKKEARPWW